MTPTEKAEQALNRRIERLQTLLTETKSDETRRYLAQAILVCVGLSETLADYVNAISVYAKTRHAEVKQAQVALTTRHAELLESGKEMLERLKANPSDRALRKEIEVMQRRMSAVQKSLRQGADSFQRELAPTIVLIDELAAILRRLAEAENKEELKRPIKSVLESVQELYRAHPALPSHGAIDPAAWKESANATLDEAGDYYDAFSRAGFQIMLALQVMVHAICEPPHSANEASERANAAVTLRLKQIAERFSRT